MDPLMHGLNLCRVVLFANIYGIIHRRFEVI